MTSFLEYLFDPLKLIPLIGLVGIVAVVFIETGLFFGFFFPGDSLLITAGLFAARGDISISALVISTIIAAILGDAVGFYIGKKLGELLYSKPNSFFFKRHHLMHAKDFYHRHGGKTIIIARFIPIVRTFVPTVAGAAEMKYFQFFIYNVIGGVLWVSSMCFGGYYLGQLLGSKINNYIHLIIGVVILLSILPILIQWVRTRHKNSNTPTNKP